MRFAVASLLWLTKMKPFFLNLKLDDKRLLVRPDFRATQLCLRRQVPLLLSLPTTRKSGSEENGPGEVALYMTEDRRSSQSSGEKVQSQSLREIDLALEK